MIGAPISWLANLSIDLNQPTDNPHHGGATVNKILAIGCFQLFDLHIFFLAIAAKILENACEIILNYQCVYFWAVAYPVGGLLVGWFVRIHREVHLSRVDSVC